MPHNPDLAPQLDFALPGHDVLSLKGPDAVAFAQAQFMNDVGALADGQWQWNGWLTSKGRVIALFALLRLDGQTLWMLLPDVAAADCAQLLQRYVFRSKVALAREETAVTAGFREPRLANASAFSCLEDRGLELDMSGDAGPRSLVLGATPAPEDPESAKRWMQADLSHGLPRLPVSQREQWTPQHLSLDRLRAFSVKKGCYPGQEIVARTHYLGQVKRGLALFETSRDAASNIAAGSEVHAAGRNIGTVACVSGNLVLAVMPLDAPTDELSTSGIDLQPRALLGGLAR
ncbi:MAG: folate-binding protein [Pseudomonadota bacterium]|nr:folate-binding protein [Pseudomonadota bacterium]MDQ3160327.1 folate-binding protein [Pseudomonadota bacterium]